MKNQKLIKEISMEIINGEWGTDWKTFLITAISDKIDELKENEHEQYYRVCYGDTLSKIAEYFCTTEEKIIEDNRSAYPTISKDFICVSWVLKV